MAVIVRTDHPAALLRDIKSGVRRGNIETWECDADGDFTHTPPQFSGKAWFRPKVDGDALVFHILGQKSMPMTKGIYAIYHGRFIEMLLAHFDSGFAHARASSLPIEGDWIGPPSR